MKAWMRLLEIHLTSKKLKRKISFGTNDDIHKDNLNIDVKGFKYMSSLKDQAVVKIDNVSYSTIVNIIDGEYYDIEIKCGYRSTGAQSIFKGGVLWVSNELNADKTHTLIILCASQMIAKYGQSRLNLSFQSGLNMYSVINFLSKRAGISNTNISTQFKKKFLQDTMSSDDTIASWLDKLTQSNPSFIINSDSITDSTFSLFDANNANQRIIKLKSDQITLIGGYPRLTEQGMTISMLPTFSFMCGDVIQIDNSIINISVSNKEQISKNYGFYLDSDGQYMIYEISYSLQNRGQQFSVDLGCKSRALISKFSGVSND